MKYDGISIYPSTQVINGSLTMDEYIDRIANKLFDDYVIGLRIKPEQLRAIIAAKAKQLGHKE